MSYRMLLLLVACLVAGAVGCSRGHVPPADTSNDQAATALRGVLDAWRSGQTPDSLRTQKPSVLAADEDWQSGCELHSYQLFDLPVHGGVAARVGALLELSTPNGRVRKEVRHLRRARR